MSHGFIQIKSDTQSQRNYRTKYGKDPPSRPSIRAWHKKFMETGTVLDKGRSGRPRTSNENIDRVRQSFLRSHTKSIRTAATELESPRSTVHKVLHKNLRLSNTDTGHYGPNLKQRIINAIATIDEAMLQRTWLEIDYRLDVLRATNGTHVEVY